MIVAVVPAAGKSERMGRPKLLLPLGPRSVIEHVLTALVRSQVDRTLVVLAPGDTAVSDAVRACGAEIIELHEPTPDMRASVVAGLDFAEATRSAEPLDAFLIALADQPTLTPRVVDHLVARFRAATRSIIVPTVLGRRAHPILFAWRHADGVRRLPPDCGINVLVAQLAGEVEECPIDDLGLLEDMDTPEEYERLVRRLKFET